MEADIVPIVSIGNIFVLIHMGITESKTQVLEPAAEFILDIKTGFLHVGGGIIAAVRGVEIGVKQIHAQTCHS